MRWTLVTKTPRGEIRSHGFDGSHDSEIAWGEASKRQMVKEDYQLLAIIPGDHPVFTGNPTQGLGFLSRIRK